jgi:EAL and modified HD-GYP domain-containing signal transduction protein
MEASQQITGAVRQPVFDPQRGLLGYEVRSEATPEAERVDQLAGCHTAFVRVTRDSLLDATCEALPSATTVVQLPGTIDSAPEVRDRCADLRRRGFRVALEDADPQDAHAALVPYLDFLSAPATRALTVVNRPAATIRPRHVVPVFASGVDSPEVFDQAAAAGCEGFQGELITRPKLSATSNIPAARLTWLRLVQALQDPDLSVIKLEELMKPDAALCLRIMRAVNGAAYAQTTRITSLRQALMLVGTTTIREWATMWTMAQFSQTSPSELVVMASVRGRFCELMTRGSIASTGGDGFLLGMCSLLDAILQTPIEAILDKLPLCASNDAALRGEPNGQRALLDAVIAYEHGQWEQSRKLAAGAGLDATLLPAAYQGAISWMARFQELSAAA